MKFSEVLRRAKTLIDTPAKWAANDSLISAGRCCALLALKRTSQEHWVEVANYFCDVTGCGSMAIFKDHHSHADVMATFDLVIAVAEREGR